MTRHMLTRWPSGVRLDVVHAWWTTVPGGLPQDTRTDLVTHERLRLSETLVGWSAGRLVGWSEKYPDVQVRASLPIGPTVLALTETAENAELLVVGSRGRGGFRSLVGRSRRCGQ